MYYYYYYYYYYCYLSCVAFVFNSLSSHCQFSFCLSDCYLLLLDAWVAHEFNQVLLAYLFDPKHMYVLCCYSSLPI